MENKKNMSQRELFLFWLPLAAMWIFMAIEQPLVSAGMARMTGAAENLAAFGICFSLALIIEGPVIQMLSAATALCGNRENYSRLMKFNHILAASLTALHLLIAIPPIYNFICGSLMGVPKELIPLSRNAFLIMIPWTAAIAYRRLFQGILIKYRRTVAVPLSMAIRITVSILIVFLGVRSTTLKGAEMGALTMAIAVIAGVLATYLLARPIIKKIPLSNCEDMPPGGDRETKSFGEIVRFYIPLGLTSVISLAIRPILAAGIARSPSPVESLAVWPVITGFLFLFQAPLLSNQEAVIALLGKGTNYREMKRFTTVITGFIGGLFIVAALSPLARWWFSHPAGLETTLLSYAIIPNIAISIIPFLSGFLAWYRGVLISRGETGIIARAVVVNAAALTLIIIILSGLLIFAEKWGISIIGKNPFIFSGATAGALAFSGAILFEMLYLRRMTMKSTKKGTLSNG